MNWLASVVRTFGPPVLSAAAATVAGWVYSHSKGAVTVDPDAVVAITGTMIGSYAVTHRILSGAINPADATGAVVDAVQQALDRGGAVTVAPTVPQTIVQGGRTYTLVK